MANNRKDIHLVYKEIKTICDKHFIIIIELTHNKLSIAATKKPKDEILSTLKFIAGVSICYDLWPKEKIDHHFNNYYEEANEEEVAYQPTPNEHAMSSSPAVAFVEDMLTLAVRKRSSDIHLEPSKQGMKIRIRVDGKLHYLPAPAYEINAEIIARLKILAKLNIAEKRLPQDGQFSCFLDKQNFSIRLSTMPTLYGEKLVLRILHTQLKYTLDQLGMPESLLQQLKDTLSSSQGLILVTGPTGSGKTITLYSSLESVNNLHRNISTIEDPIEIPINGINQIQVNEKYSLGFANILRSLLRQDPDIVMIGEIRDEETAKIAVRAAQTGHLVLSTLHTNGTINTVSRLEQLGIAPSLLASCVKIIIAQRLIRMLCTHCRQQESQPITVSHDKKNIEIVHWKAKGCEHCFSGYIGRTAIYEFITHHELDSLVNNPHTDHSIIYDKLFDFGLNLVQQGVTSLQELYSITGKNE